MSMRAVVLGTVCCLRSVVQRRSAYACGLALGVIFGAGSLSAEPLKDRLDMPAPHSKKPAGVQINGLESAGERLVAVGQHGHILWSDDDGRSWSQAQVPVSSDLTAVQFINARLGWAVGHDGVVLHSQDGGQSWGLQLDGRRLAELLKSHASTLDQTLMKSAVVELERSASQGPDQSLLGLYFLDSQNGYVVGANNLVLRTTDGGRTWQPCSELVANPRTLHLYDITEAAGRLFIVGEQGLILRQSDDGQSFESLQSPYHGSWFGILGRPDRLLIYGLRGNAWISTDAGNTWLQSKLESNVALVAASTSTSGQLLLASLSGEVFSSDDDGLHFKALELDQRYPFAALASPASAGLVVAGVHGVRVADLSAEGRQP